jgi:3',5'-cyclic-AMP phosphodiesterase
MKSIKLVWRMSAVLIVLILISLISFDCGGKSGSFRFVFMTDIHLTGDRNAVEKFRQAIASVNKLRPRPDFVITGGDNIMDALGQPLDKADSLFTLYQREIKGFDMPVYTSMGNHDFSGVYISSGVDTANPDWKERLFLKKFGREKPYLSFNRDGCHFILLNSIYITPQRTYTGRVDTAQLAWLARDLKENGKERPVFIVTHIPLYSARVFFSQGSLAANQAGNVVANSDQVWKICQDYPVRAVLQGHLHVLEEIVWKGTRFITGGAVCGAWWNGSYEGFPPGYVVLDVNGDTIDWHYQTFLPPEE